MPPINLLVMVGVVYVISIYVSYRLYASALYIHDVRLGGFDPAYSTPWQLAKDGLDFAIPIGLIILTPVVNILVPVGMLITGIRGLRRAAKERLS